MPPLFLFFLSFSLLQISLFHFRGRTLNPCYNDTFNCETNETTAKCNKYIQDDRDNMYKHNLEFPS